MIKAKVRRNSSGPATPSGYCFIKSIKRSRVIFFNFLSKTVVDYFEPLTGAEHFYTNFSANCDILCIILKNLNYYV